MYLTNQHFTSSSAVINEPVAVKDKQNQFTVTSDNMWNNAHRASIKISKFYHDREIYLNCNPNLSNSPLSLATHLSDFQHQQVVIKEHHISKSKFVNTQRSRSLLRQ